MAKEDVSIKVSANVAEAIQMWKAMEKGPEGMAKALEGMGKKGKDSTKSLGSELTGYIGKWASVAAVIKLATDAVNEQIEAVRKLREERVTSTNMVDEVMNRVLVQSGVANGPAGDRLRTQLLNIGATRKAAPVQTLMAAEMLGGAGASVQDIVGGGLDEFLKLTTATNAMGKGVDQAELARSLVMFLEANKLKPNREGMASTSLAIQQIFGGTNLQLSNLARFAPEAATIRQATGLDEVEQLAIFSQFLGTKEEAGASVSFRSGASRMRTFGGYPERMAALKRLGLKPEDVDFEGEGYYGAMKRLQEGFAGVSPEKQSTIAARLFGEEGMGYYNVLLQPGAAEETKRRVAMARSDKGAAQRLATAESSRGAAAREAETLAAVALHNRQSLDPEVVQNRLIALTSQLGMSESQTAYLENTLERKGVLGLNMIFGDIPLEQRIENTAAALALKTRNWGQTMDMKAPTKISQETAAGMLRGEIEIRLNMKVDGHDVSTQIEAIDLQDKK